jgi:serine/threonine protein phosphatase PrpC
MTSTLAFSALTDPGIVRQHNEDSIAVHCLPDKSAGFAILADGMGGHNAGEVASAMAIEVLMDALADQLPHLLQIAWPDSADLLRQRIVDSVKLANWKIFDAACDNEEYQGMGTTLVLALFHHDKATIAHVGDSRLYRMRDGILQQITLDHSVLQEQIDAGLITPEEAQFSQNKNVITRALGVEPEVLVDIYEVNSQDGDLYLLCSDGLSDMLLPQEISADLTRFCQDKELACQALIDHANALGGRDNISVILAQQINAIAVDDGGGMVLRWVG